MEIIDWPKTQCPYKRDYDEKRRYIVQDELYEGMEWIFEPGVRAVDKLHGQPGCFLMDKGEIKLISSRKHLVSDNPGIKANMTKEEIKFIRGYLNASSKGWMKGLHDGYIYGELVGPDINKNLHCVDDYYFVPFSVLVEKFHWKSWVENKYPKNFNSLSEWFKELPSLFTKRCAADNSHRLCNFAEGLVFWHPDGRRAKLRRDMYSWYYEGSDDG